MVAIISYRRKGRSGMPSTKVPKCSTSRATLGTHVMRSFVNHIPSTPSSPFATILLPRLHYGVLMHDAQTQLMDVMILPRASTSSACTKVIATDGQKFIMTSRWMMWTSRMRKTSAGWASAMRMGDASPDGKRQLTTSPSWVPTTKLDSSWIVGLRASTTRRKNIFAPTANA